MKLPPPPPPDGVVALASAPTLPAAPTAAPNVGTLLPNGFAANDAAPKGEAARVPPSEGVEEEEAAGAAGMPPAPAPAGKRLLVPASALVPPPSSSSYGRLRDVTKRGICTLWPGICTLWPGSWSPAVTGSAPES